jgi:5-methylcytosine-specific restriction endonuclease McrA
MSENASGEANGDSTAADKDFSCDYCGDGFASQVTKRRHEKNFHAEELPHRCPDCDTAFHDRQGLVSHHTQKHDGRLAGYDKTCGVCGEDFTTSKKSVKYCSPECGSRAQRKRVTLECERCGDNFETTPSQVDGKRFCSIECKGEWFSEHFTGENHPSYDPGKHVEKACKYCGDKFTVATWELNDDTNAGTYCSKECLNEWRRENWVGENNPLYQGGDQYYGENWHRQRRKALKRDQYRCQACRTTTADLPREPSVHHIRPIREYDDPETANTLNNLISLCEPCHAKYELRYMRQDTRDADA